MIIIYMILFQFGRENYDMYFMAIILLSNQLFVVLLGSFLIRCKEMTDMVERGSFKMSPMVREREREINVGEKKSEGEKGKI